MKIQHIYWFAAYHLSSASTRYRGHIPHTYFEKHHSITSDFVFPQRTLTGVWRFLRVFCSVLFARKPNSLLVIQKVCSNGFYANALKILLFFRPGNTQYDLDDAEQFRKDTRSLHFFMRTCKIVTVGSTALQEYAQTFNSQVFLLTSPIPQHLIRKGKRNQKIHIGWVGDLGNGNPISQAFSHKTSMFRLFFPFIREMKEPLILTLIGVKNQEDIEEIKAYFNFSTHLELRIPEALYWQQDEWVYPMIATFDIGVAPMLDHPFNQAKSAFKVKQYLSVGVPAIASRVGENQKFIRHRQNGFLCNDPQDFMDAIAEIIEMDDLEYQKMSKQALQNREAYSIELYCRQILAAHGGSRS